ncbi:acyl carrier protein [Streptomyces hygroscopicus]|uniref:acyl carrier protein n=1 Tax=Streptomyces hygroscopicus TaxID=1912 RepID=UPI0006919C43|nr:phosphopantetheine-binding protein [Streptomyces hygroscopicus]
MSPAEAGPAEHSQAEAVRAELLDCLQANLALLADRHHGPGTHLRLGARLRFAPRPGPGGLPTVEPTLEDQLADAEELLGLTVATRESGVGGAAVAATTEPVYVVADAHHLPWVPYFGHRHVEHSFLVEPGADGDTVEVTDGYHNDTQWGKARPATHTYGRAELAAILAADAHGAEVLRLAPRPLGPAPRPATDLGADPGADRVAEYLRAYTEHPDRVAALERFTLETWLLARARKLYAQYAAGGPGAPVDPAVAGHLARWDGVVEHAYLTFRRVARGRAEPPELLARAADVLRADATVLAGAGTAPETEGDGEPRSTVRAVVASVLGLDEHLVPETELTGLAEFSSLRMVEIVEGLESAFGVEFGPDDLVPEKLHRIDDLCGLVRRALAGR